MKMKKIFALAAAAVLLLPMTSCFVRINNESIRKLNKGQVVGNGVLVSDRRSLDAFDDLALEGGIDVRFVQADVDPYMDIEVSENLLPFLKSEVKDGVLTVRFYSDTLSSYTIGQHSLTIYAPKLSSVGILGSGDFTCESLSTEGEFDLSMAGSGDIKLAGLHCQGLDIAIAGSGDIKADAQVEGAVSVSIAGSGDVVLSGRAGSADYSIAGSGDIDVRNLEVSGPVNQSVFGSGDIRTR